MIKGHVDLKYSDGSEDSVKKVIFFILNPVTLLLLLKIADL